MSPRVLFEPIGEEIEVGEDETVLEAAFRQGYNLAYGCREGQCSACKCYLLEGEVDLLPSPRSHCPNLRRPTATR